MITVGVLGGIGPEATGIFYQKLIARLQQEGIRANEDFPRIIINSIPAPELVHGRISEDDLAQYHRGLETLDALRPDFIVMVCNTIHLFYDELQQRLRTPILSLPLAVEGELRRRNVRCAGILATQSTIRHGLYWFNGIRLIAPPEEELALLMQDVVRYNSGQDKEQAIARAAACLRQLLDAGAQCVILGCTEFAAMLQEPGLPVIDTIEVLADATVERWRILRGG